MKAPMMLVCAMMTAMSMSVFAEQAATAAVANTPAATVKAAKSEAKAAKMEAAREARIAKFMEETKVTNPTLYSELAALKEKDPAAFKTKVLGLIKEQRAAAKGTAKKAKAAK